MVSTLDSRWSSPALAGDIVLCSWAKHLILSVSLHPGVKMDTGKLNAGDNPAVDQHPIQGE